MLLAMLGTWEIVIILVVVVLILGPSKLPALGTGIAKMLSGFKREMKSVDDGTPKADADKEIDVTPAAPVGSRRDD